MHIYAPARGLFIGAFALLWLVDPAWAQTGTVSHAANGVVDRIDGVADMIPGWFAALTTLMVAIKAITTVTPTQADNRILAALLRLLNVVALNVGKARNADDRKAK